MDKFLLALDDDTVPTSDAGACLGLGVMACQRAIDEAVNRQFPLMALAYYPKGVSFGTDDIKSVGGLYFVGIERGARWLQCTLQVRYLLKISGGFVLRSKLVIPNLMSDTEDWAYDGMVRRLGSRLYFCFDKRPSSGERKDFFFLILAPCRPEVGLPEATYEGQYLTSNQDFDQTTVSGRALAWRVDKKPDDQDFELQKIQERRMKQVWDLGKADLPVDAEVDHLKDLVAALQLRDGGSKAAVAEKRGT